MGLHSVVDILVDFEPMYPGFQSRESPEFFLLIFFYYFFMFFFVFFVIITTVQFLQIQHYCLYSDSPTLLPLMMPMPPAPSALWFYLSFNSDFFVSKIMFYELGIFHANRTTKCLRNQGRTKGEGWSTANLLKPPSNFIAGRPKAALLF